MFTGKHCGGTGKRLFFGIPLDHFQGKIALHLDLDSTGGEKKILAYAAFVLDCPWGFAASSHCLSVSGHCFGMSPNNCLHFVLTHSPTSWRTACHGAAPLFPMQKHELMLCFPCRSSQGFMHMKLMKTKEKYILGQNSPPFDSVPEVIHYYTTKKLPIKGAEHLSLLYPVAVRTLW